MASEHEHDADAVVARIAANMRITPIGVRHVLEGLKPGDRLPGGLVVKRQGKTKTVRAGTKLCGGKLVAVPTEPTEAMLAATKPVIEAAQAAWDDYEVVPPETVIGPCYRAMLRAASGDT